MNVFGTDKTMKLLVDATELAERKPEVGWGDIQEELKVGASAAFAIMDWLADNHKAQWKVTNHWVRAGRTYVLNNPAPRLEEMATFLRVGEQRSVAIMNALMKKKLITVNTNYFFQEL